MKSVLISIQPKWCKLISSGKKTVEVRKSKPKLETPFKVYIYCTQDKNFTFCTDDGEQYTHIGNGKVIGEFVCDRIGYIINYGDAVDSYDCKASCLSAKEIIDYAKDKDGNFVHTYGWHISDLVIYDKPRELGEFYTFKKCTSCESGYESTACSYDEDCRVPVKLTRPPQSWCYVEGRSDTDA